jgi:pilus assembly protein CpaF
MNKMSKLLDEFNVKRNEVEFANTEYEMFQDKKALDEYRIKILEDLSNKGFANQVITKDLIESEIDELTLGEDLSNNERIYLFNLIDGEVNGFGPITELLHDDSITEIMVNSPSEVYIEIDGVLEKDDSISFIDDDHITRTIERLIEPVGKTIDVNNPMVDARLVDGSRINAVIPPLSKNPIITIRKFRKSIVDMDNLVGNGSLTPYMARFLEASVQAKLNIIVAGPSGAGKTTLLNILSNYIPDDERIITIEDVMELNLNQSNVVSLETKSANYDGIGEVTMRDLVRNSLRMRPDRIVIGEVRGAEAFDLLQAMNTGHDGSLTSLHANGCKDALDRLETMILMSNIDVPMTVLREYIDNAIDLVVYITRMKDGKRKITNISEVINVDSGDYVLNTIFEFRSRGMSENGSITGEYELKEYVPDVLKKIRSAGIRDLDDMFNFKKNNKGNKNNKNKKK